MASNFANSWQKHTPGNMKQIHNHHILYYMFVLFLVKTSNYFTADTVALLVHATPWILLSQTSGPWVVLTRLLWTVKSEATEACLPHTHNRRCWSEAAPDCCMVWPAATCHWRDNRPMAWTAARLRENRWTTLQTSYSLSVSYFTWTACQYRRVHLNSSKRKIRTHTNFIAVIEIKYTRKEWKYFHSTIKCSWPARVTRLLREKRIEDCE